MSAVKTLNEFIIERQQDFPYATGELSAILRDIGLAAKVINREVNKAGLTSVLGAAGSDNVQGEQQQKLDVYANHQFIEALRYGHEICAVASEENEEIIIFDNENSKKGKYIIAFDPLDGSSNIDVNVSIGTIFSIYRRENIQEQVSEKDFFQKGKNQVAAGYVIYGSSTMLVYTTGKGVNGFTLDPSIGEFCLSHPSIQIPSDGKTFSINEGNFKLYPKGVQEYINYCKEEDSATNRPYSARYIGSMVADLHRNLIKGGIFIYPATSKSPNGKLRLLYECNPMAFIVEQAGGKASTGSMDVMEVQLSELHQRCPIFIGSTEMVEKACEFFNKNQEVTA